MYKLLKAFFKAKYNFDDCTINKIITESENNKDLAEWYQIAITFYHEEMLKNCN